LSKITSRFVKETWFFLFNDVLIYAYDVVGSYVFKGEIALGTTWLRDLIDTPAVQNAFQIVSSKKTYTVYATSTEEKKSWVMAIQKCIAALVAKKPELIEQRSDINVRRSWLSWLPETVGLTFSPEDFDPHGAGYSSTSSRSSARISSRDSRSSWSRNTKTSSSRQDSGRVETASKSPAFDTVYENGGKEESAEEDPQNSSETAPLIRGLQEQRASYYKPPSKPAYEEECCCILM